MPIDYEEYIPVHILHLETGVLFVFLAALLWNQLARSRDSIHYSQHAKTLLALFAGVWAALSVVFAHYLGSLSPLLAVELATGFTLALLHPVNALCFFIHLFFLRPWDVVPRVAILLVLPKLLIATSFLSWVFHPWIRGKPTPEVTRALGLLLGFSAWLYLTTFMAQNIAFAQSDWFRLYFRSLIVLLMCLYFVDDARSLIELKHTIVISVLGMILIGLDDFFFGSSAMGATAARLHTFGKLADPNDLASITIMILPLILTPMARSATSFPARLVGFFLALFSVWAIWLSRSRGALLALAVLAVWMWGVRDFHKRRLQVVLLACLLGIGYVGLLKVIPRSAEDTEISTESRIAYWKAAINMTLHHPIWGVGYSQYPFNYVAYSRSPIYEWGLRTAHSTWFLIFAESGFVGGFLYVAFYVRVFRIAWRRRLDYPDQLYALVGYSVPMSFLSHAYLLFPYLLYGLILASDSVKSAPAQVA